MEAIYIILGGLIIICGPLALYFRHEDKKNSGLKQK